MALTCAPLFFLTLILARDELCDFCKWWLAESGHTFLLLLSKLEVESWRRIEWYLFKALRVVDHLLVIEHSSALIFTRTWLFGHSISKCLAGVLGEYTTRLRRDFRQDREFFTRLNILIGPRDQSSLGRSFIKLYLTFLAVKVLTTLICNPRWIIHTLVGCNRVVLCWPRWDVFTLVEHAPRRLVSRYWCTTNLVRTDFVC